MERSGSTGILGMRSAITGITGRTGITGSSGSGRAAPSGGRPRALLPSLCLLLALTTLTALPTPARALPTPRHILAERLNRSRDLLKAASDSLPRLKESDLLGFNCTLEEVDLEDITDNQINTIKACTSHDPGTGNCPALERSGFDKGKCLQGIYEDLSAYRAELSNFSDHQVLATLDGMMKALRSSGGTVPERQAGAGPPSFQGQLRLCGVLQALRIRSVTITRVLNFLSSLESSQ